MNNLFQNGASFLVILNPFALCLYLWGAMDDLDGKTFFRVLLQASGVSCGIFILFAGLGEQVLSTLGIEPGALRLFGGLIFLIIAYNYVTRGYRAVEMLRGRIEDLPSSIAVPFMIGAGTITQAILIGQQHDLLVSSGLFLAILTVSFLTVALFYVLRRHIREKFEPVFDRYVNILARINGLVVGAISIGMILDGSVMLLERKGLIP